MRVEDIRRSLDYHALFATEAAKKAEEVAKSIGQRSLADDLGDKKLLVETWLMVARAHNLAVEAMFMTLKSETGKQ